MPRKPRTRFLHDPRDGRLRAVWRILIPFVAVMAGLTAIDLGLVAPIAGTPAAYAVGGAGRLLLVVAVIAVTARVLDRRRLRGYGLGSDRAWWADAAVGAAIGLVMFAASTGVALAAGWVRIQEVLSPAATGGLWLVLALAVFRLATVSLWEELLFRGVMIKNGAESLVQRRSPTTAVVIATLISTLVFALIHVPQHVGSGQPMLRMVWMWLALGALMALGYVLTGRLALPLGLHLTVNFALQHLFVLWGDAAAPTATILQLEVVGPASLAGIGGWLHVGAVAVATVLLLGWVRWRYGGLRVHPAILARSDARSPADEVVVAHDHGAAGADQATAASGCVTPSSR